MGEEMTGIGDALRKHMEELLFQFCFDELDKPEVELPETADSVVADILRRDFADAH
jgi:hypothetical protein